MTNICLDDGRVISKDNFEIRDHQDYRLTAEHKWAIKRADRGCPESNLFSIAIATRREVIALTLEQPNEDHARAVIGEMLTDHYAHRGGNRPMNGLVALLTYPPTQRHAQLLASEGVSVLFLRERLSSEAESMFIKFWLGPNLRASNEGPRDELERHILVQPKWEAKS